jgi:hypothetical protein
VSEGGGVVWGERAATALSCPVLSSLFHVEKIAEHARARARTRCERGKKRNGNKNLS